MLFERTYRLGRRGGRKVSITETSGLDSGKYWQLDDAILLEESNRQLRDLLLTKGHLMLQRNVRGAAHCFIEHYDSWLRRAAAPLVIGKAKREQGQRVDSIIIPSVPDSGCLGFPDGQDSIVIRRFYDLQRTLYGEAESQN